MSVISMKPYNLVTLSWESMQSKKSIRGRERGGRGQDKKGVFRAMTIGRKAHIAESKRRKHFKKERVANKIQNKY